MRNKLIAAGLAGIGYGVLVGWAATADIIERKMLGNQRLMGDIIDRQAAELVGTKELLLKMQGGTNNYHVTVNNGGESTPETVAEAVEEAISNGEKTDYNAAYAVAEKVTESEQEGEERPPFPPGETTEQTRSRLQEQINRYNSDPVQQEEFNHLVAQSLEIDETPPYVISQAAYAWDEEGDDHEKITLTYYPQYQLLLENDDEVVDDVPATIGWKALNQFGYESNDPDVVFVRNRRTRTDFEVVRDSENQPPLHVRFNMNRVEFDSKRAAGQIRFRDEDA